MLDCPRLRGRPFPCVTLSMLSLRSTVSFHAFMAFNCPFPCFHCVQVSLSMLSWRSTVPFHAFMVFNGPFPCFVRVVYRISPPHPLSHTLYAFFAISVLLGRPRLRFLWFFFHLREFFLCQHQRYTYWCLAGYRARGSAREDAKPAKKRAPYPRARPRPS